MSRDNGRWHGENQTERRFVDAATEAGLHVLPSPSIRCDHPVPNKHGEIVKTVTHPDCLVVNPQTEQAMHVEVTQGSGDWESKAAQRRVVEAAGVDNYVQLTGDQIEALVRKQTNQQKRELLFSYFGWDDSEER